jgi:Smr domain/Domain of unknown function (DUF2027)
VKNQSLLQRNPLIIETKRHIISENLKIFQQNNMNIGDRVRLLRGREEGVIVKILPNNIIEIEIEDGFKIPIKRNEAVMISPDEALRFKKQGPEIAPQRQGIAPEIVANNGVFMAFCYINDRELSQHLINNSDWDMPFMLSVGSDPHHRGLAAGVLKARSSTKVQDIQTKDFEEWGTFTFQGIFHRGAFMALRPVLVKHMKFRAHTFFKTKAKAPILNKDAFLFQLDAEGSETVVIEPRKLVEKMFEPNSIMPEKPMTSTKPSAVVDLHIEQLSSQHTQWSNQQIIDCQLAAFEQAFESAIASGLDHITFIHGVGNGVLRQALHRRLAGHKNVKFFEDAQKEKFGYGATKVSIK